MNAKETLKEGIKFVSYGIKLKFKEFLNPLISGVSKRSHIQQ